MIDRSKVPAPVKQAGRAVSRRFGQATSRWRSMPDFMLIGGNRCGTTALHRALIAHPLVAPPVFHKGVNYFDVNYFRGPDWYAGHFPTRLGARLRSGQRERRPLVMEACGYYLDHPAAAQRIHRDLPDTKFIVMLRDPVERAHSAHRHNVARGMERRSFEEVIELEPLWTRSEAERMLEDPTYESWTHRHGSPVRRGQYVDRLEEHLRLFGRNRVFVLFSEEYSVDPAPHFDRVLEFLDLPPFRPAAGFGRWNASPPAELRPETRRRLREHYAPYDARLAELLGVELPWPGVDDDPALTGAAAAAGA
jgi:hypothetical protein